MKVAERLNAEVEMSEGEFRDLLKSIFKSAKLPSYHISTIVRRIRTEGKKGRMQVIASRVGSHL